MDGSRESACREHQGPDCGVGQCAHAASAPGGAVPEEHSAGCGRSGDRLPGGGESETGSEEGAPSGPEVSGESIELSTQSLGLQISDSCDFCRTPKSIPRDAGEVESWGTCELDLVEGAPCSSKVSGHFNAFIKFVESVRSFSNLSCGMQEKWELLPG
jgi:hypothetical protein